MGRPHGHGAGAFRLGRVPLADGDHAPPRGTRIAQPRANSCGTSTRAWGRSMSARTDIPTRTTRAAAARVVGRRLRAVRGGRGTLGAPTGAPQHVTAPTGRPAATLPLSPSAPPVRRYARHSAHTPKRHLIVTTPARVPPARPNPSARALRVRCLTVPGRAPQCLAMVSHQTHLRASPTDDGPTDPRALRRALADRPSGGWRTTLRTVGSTDPAHNRWTTLDSRMPGALGAGRGSALRDSGRAGRSKRGPCLSDFNAVGRKK